MFIAQWIGRKKPRFYARLDELNCCETLWATTTHPPDTGRWVEVTELNQFWIGRPLPPSARCHTDTAARAAALYI